FDLAPVGIEYAVAEVGFWVGRRLHEQHLIGTDAEMAIGQRAGAFRRHVDGLAHAVEYDEVVAGAVHFREGPHHACDYTEGMRLSRSVLRPPGGSCSGGAP